MAGVAELFKNESVVINKKGKKIDLLSHCAGKTIFLYFSALWCPPCRIFTPKLIEFYNIHRINKNFEIIFISSDNNEDAFREYYKDMPWLALEFKFRSTKVCCFFE